jgi:hypothetical protein
VVEATAGVVVVVEERAFEGLLGIVVLVAFLVVVLVAIVGCILGFLLVCILPVSFHLCSFVVSEDVPSRIG